MSAEDYQARRLADGTACLEAALEYLAYGWSVLALCTPDHVGMGRAHADRCGSPGKAPWHLWKELQDRLPAEDEVRGWWGKNPWSNVGCALGPVSGMVRVDVEGPLGEARLLELAAGDLPPTLEFASGRESGGRGLLYGIPPDARLRTTAQPLAVGEELRLQAKGAQTVLPPSKHESGRYYEWKDGHSPLEMQIAPAPAWLLAELAEDKPGGKRKQKFVAGEIIPEGTRDETMASFAGSMRRRGMSEEAMYAALLVENQERCDPPLAEADIRRIAHSIARYDPEADVRAMPRAAGSNGNGSSHEPDPWDDPLPLQEIPAVPAFPLSVLPPRLAEFVADVAAAVNCPVDFPAVTLLAIAGSAAGATRTLKVKDEYFERPCLYAALVGPPGAAKSPAIATVAKPLYREQTHLAAQHRLAVEQWRDADPGIRGTKPTRKALQVKNATVEAIADLLQHNPRGMVQVLDELVSLVFGLNQYKPQGAGTDRQFYLSVWAGEPIDVARRKEDGSVFVAHPFLGVVGGLTPDLLGRLRGKEGVLDGFFDRFLIAYPDSIPEKGEDWKTVGRHGMECWANALRVLWDMQMLAAEGDDPVRPIFIGMSQRATAFWEEFTQDLAAEVNDPTFPEFLRSPWRKLKGYCARLTLVCHLLAVAVGDERSSDSVGEQAVASAVRLIDYFKSHARKAYAALDMNPDVRAAKRLLEWVRRHPEKTFRRWEALKDLQNKSAFNGIEAIDGHLACLQKHGYIRLVMNVSRPTGAGRPPGPTYEIHPLENHREYRENREN